MDADEKDFRVLILCIYIYIYSRRKFKEKLPTIWRVENQMHSSAVESSSQFSRQKMHSSAVESSSQFSRQKMQECQSQVKEDTSALNVRDVTKCCVFSMIRVSGQSKSRPVKAAGAEIGAQRRNQKLHAAVAKSTFGSENVQNMTCSAHFCKFRCRKIARGCGEKHIWKSKC